MNCKTCDYRLWNLTARTCPECGSPFKPSDFEFTLNSVQYCCPHCDQQYYGTDEIGHLIPREFDCVACGQHLQMDMMVLRPAGNVKEEQTERDRNPWLVRRKIGFIKAWFAMVGRGMVTPGPVMRVTPVESSTNDAWWFLILTSLLFTAVAVFPLVAFFVVMAIITSAGGGGGGRMMMAGIGTPLLIYGGGVFFGTVIFVAIWGVVTHAILWMTGPIAGGLARTYQTLCYGAGANVFSALPCFGCYFGWVGYIWWAVCSTLMVQEGQQVSGGRAVLATLTMPALAAVLAVGGFLGLIYYDTAFQQAFAGPGGISAYGTGTINNALISQALGPRGNPGHASDLVRRGAIMGYELVNAPTSTSTTDVPIGSVSLATYEAAGDSAQQRYTDAAIDALPSGVIAHRLGDFVFTYHGIDINDAIINHPGLWLVILSPDPDINGQTPADPVEVGQADGTTFTFPAADLSSQLATQNQMRQAAYGLSPLPDPAAVTHDQPAQHP